MKTAIGLATSDSCDQETFMQAAPVVETFTDPAAFDRLRQEWNGLRQPGSDQNPFFSCDWFACWWKAFGSHRRLLLVTVRKNGRLQAVLPMMLEASWRYGVPLRRLATIGNDHTPCFDLVRADNEEDLYRIVWNHLMNLRGE